MSITILYTALAGAAGFIAALISFLFNSQLESILRYANGALSRQVEGSVRQLFLALGLVAFLLLLSAVIVAVIQYWEAVVLLVAAGVVIGYAWIQTLQLLSLIDAAGAAGAAGPAPPAPAAPGVS